MVAEETDNQEDFTIESTDKTEASTKDSSKVTERLLLHRTLVGPRNCPSLDLQVCVSAPAIASRLLWHQETWYAQVFQRKAV